MSAEQYIYKVIHDDAWELGMAAPVFDTEEEAIAKKDEWNKEYPGHYISKERKP
jgi:hypothetical protein